MRKSTATYDRNASHEETRRAGRRWLWGSIIAGVCVPLAVIGGVGTAFLVLGIETDQSGAAFLAILGLSPPETLLLIQLCILNALPFLIFGVVAQLIIVRYGASHGRVRPVIVAGLTILTVCSIFLWAATASTVYQILGSLSSTGQDWPILALRYPILMNLGLGLAAAVVGMILVWLLCLIVGAAGRRAD